jgi:beta-fructofuranosidase
VDDGGVPTAAYSGLVEAHADTAVCLAYAEDLEGLTRWRKEPAPVVVPPAGIGWTGFRDPFVFRVGARRYAVLGGGTADDGPVLSLFACDDLRDWRPLGRLLDLADPVAAAVAGAQIWECPSLVEVDGRWVLVLSLIRDDSLGRVVWLSGILSPRGETLRFEAADGGLVDHGHDFYAPTVLLEESRTLMWGWTWEDRPLDDVDAAGWAGALTWPRVLELSEAGRLVTRPAPELEELRGPASEVAFPVSLSLPHEPVELVLTAVEPLALRLDGLEVSLDPVAGTVRTSRAVHTAYRKGWPSEGQLAPGPVRLRVVVDGSVIEVYAEGGPTFTERVYPNGPRQVTVSSPVPGRMTVYPLTAG